MSGRNDPFSGFDASDITIQEHHDVYSAIDPRQYASDAFKDQVVIVTGSGRAIGRSTVQAFASLGAKVVVNGRSASEVEKTRDEIIEQYGPDKAIAVVGDLTKKGECERLVKETTDKWGRVDVLVGNAGMADWVEFKYSTSDDWWYIMEINLRVPIDLTRLVLPGMLQRNFGKIILTTSRAAAGNFPFTSCKAYNVSKTGLVRFVGSVKNEIKDSAVEIFAMHPGDSKLGDINYITTPENRKRSPQLVEWITKFFPMLIDTPTLPAWTAVFLASGKAAKLNGRYIDSNHDIGQVLEHFDDVQKRRLYDLKIDFLKTTGGHLERDSQTKKNATL
ncbi:NAD(P)-binding protein [Atractiella rhizophila]|nr:NAD(P)-binding protein [Atractiella rhizophila]